MKNRKWNKKNNKCPLCGVSINQYHQTDCDYLFMKEKARMMRSKAGMLRVSADRIEKQAHNIEQMMMGKL